jgi:hypothetical protein
MRVFTSRTETGSNDMQRLGVHAADVYVDLLVLAKDSADLAEYVTNRLFRTEDGQDEPEDREPGPLGPPGADVLIKGITDFNSAVLSAAELRVAAMLDPDSPEHAVAKAATSWYRVLYGDEQRADDGEA